MLTWYKELYEATAADEASSFLTHLWTPAGTLHDPGASGRISHREDWLVRYAQVVVLATTTGLIKPGLMGELALGMDYPGSWTPISTPEGGVLHPNRGLIYAGAELMATHGIGWAFYKGALADTDKVFFRVLYDVQKKY